MEILLAVELGKFPELNKRGVSIKHGGRNFFLNQKAPIVLSYTLLDQVFSSISMDQDFYEKVIPGVGFQSPLLIWIQKSGTFLNFFEA